MLRNAKQKVVVLFSVVPQNVSVLFENESSKHDRLNLIFQQLLSYGRRCFSVSRFLLLFTNLLLLLLFILQRCDVCLQKKKEKQRILAFSTRLLLLLLLTRSFTNVNEKKKIPAALLTMKYFFTVLAL